MPKASPQSPSLALRPNPNSANNAHAGDRSSNPTSTPTSANTNSATASAIMSNPTTVHGIDAPAHPATARRQSVAEALAASADLEEALVSPTSDHHPGSPTAPHHDEAGAERARTATQAWKPAMDRRQSWSKEEHKRSLQMSSIADVKEGPGFSERAQ